MGTPSHEPAQIEEVSAPAAEHVTALARLVPQLSSARAPDLDRLRAIAADPAVRLLVARRDGEIVGTLTLVLVTIPTGVRAIIEDVVVDGDASGHGVGGALVRHALTLAREGGARTVDLTSRPSRVAANHLYEREGFVRRETNVFRRDLDA